MKKIYVFILLIYFTDFKSVAQDNQLFFDGTNDYVDLGTNALTGVRTVEMWFTPASSITSSSLSDYVSLVARNDATQTDELNLSFAPPAAGTEAGKLLFFRNIAGTNYFISSNSNSWTAGVCYHVAAVIDPANGMRMYINGVLQSDTEPSITTAPAAASEITALGRYGDQAIRHYHGRIDEVRFWTNARSAGEILSSYQLSMGTSATGLYAYWKFNEGTGLTAGDAVGSNDGTISGAVWLSTGSCLVGTNEELVQNVSEISIFPNPINENSMLKISNVEKLKYTLNITDVSGKLLMSMGGLTQEQIDLNTLCRFESGVYLLNIRFENAKSISTRILVN